MLRYLDEENTTFKFLPASCDNYFSKCVLSLPDSTDTKQNPIALVWWHIIRLGYQPAFLFFRPFCWIFIRISHFKTFSTSPGKDPSRPTGNHFVRHTWNFKDKFVPYLSIRLDTVKRSQPCLNCHFCSNIEHWTSLYGVGFNIAFNTILV